jgi:hypothetical protein
MSYLCLLIDVYLGNKDLSEDSFNNFWAYSLRIPIRNEEKGRKSNTISASVAVIS